MRLILQLFALIVLVLITWVYWQMPRTPPPPAQQQAVRTSIPAKDFGGTKEEMWRVVTRKLVWQQAAHAMQQQLQQDGFTVIPLTRRETVELYAFDDPRTFATSEQATLVELNWKKIGIEAQVIHVGDHYGVALGRFFMPEYAEEAQRKLEKSGKPYHYEKRTVDIPVYRFAFPAAKQSAAQKLWQHLQDIGIADPALIREDHFQSLYGDITKSGQ